LSSVRRVLFVCLGNICRSPTAEGVFRALLAREAPGLAVEVGPRHSRARLQLFLEYAPDAGRLEMPDPYYGGASGFEEVLDLSAAASRGLLASLQNVA